MMSSCLGIAYLPFRHHLGTEIFADKTGSIQINLSTEDFTEFEFKPHQLNQSDPRSGFELHEYIDITVRAKCIAQHRAEKGKPFNPVCLTEFGQLLFGDLDPGFGHLLFRFHLTVMACFSEVISTPQILNGVDGKYLQLPVLSREQDDYGTASRCGRGASNVHLDAMFPISRFGGDGLLGC
jgi:hypothetical protein